MYRLTRTSAAAPIPLDTFPTVSYPRAEAEETEIKVRPVSTEKKNTNRLDVGEGPTPTCKQHLTTWERQSHPRLGRGRSGDGAKDRNGSLWLLWAR